jgi:LuxR family maltose regulon positive regulatory protein
MSSANVVTARRLCCGNPDPTRPRLRERLNRGATSKLTLVSAPAGFGKTTLLADWLGAADADVRLAAWLSLDHNDNHPPSFSACH